jgi:hypothetical protein
MRAAAVANDDAVVLELVVDDDDGGVRVWLHAIEGAFRGAVLAEFTPGLGLVVDDLAREAVAACMPLARALEFQRARYAARRRLQPWAAGLPRRLPAHAHLDAHVLYLEFAWPYMFVPGALSRLLAAWGLREPPGCACPALDWAFTPTPPHRGTRDETVALFCQRCWRCAPPSWR